MCKHCLCVRVSCNKGAFGLAHAPLFSQRHSKLYLSYVNLACAFCNKGVFGLAHAPLCFTNMFEYSCLVCVSLPCVVHVRPTSFPSITPAVRPNDMLIVMDLHNGESGESGCQSLLRY